MKNRSKKKTSQKSESEYSGKNIRKILSNGLWVYKLIFRMAPVEATFLIIASIAEAAVPTLTTYLNSRFIDQIVTAPESGIRSIQDLDFSSIIVLILLASIFASVVNAISRRTSRYLFDKFRRYYLKDYQTKLSLKISQLDVQQFESPKISNSIQKAKDNFYKIEVFLRNSLDLTSQILAVVIAGVISFKISPWLSVIIIILSIPNNLVFAKFIVELWKFYNNNVERNRKIWWMAGELENEQNIPEHKITKSGDYIYGILDPHNKSYLEDQLRFYKINYRGSILAIFINAINYLVTPLLLLDRLLKGNITIGQFTFFQSKLFDFSGNLDWMLGLILEFFDSGTYISFVRDILEMEPAIKSGKTEINTDKPPKIEFKNVSFKYPQSKKWALRNISFTIEPGQEIAIVGENGAGKTTLIKLLMRFYDPDEGEILIDRKPLQTLSLETYYKLVSTLFQEYNMYRELNIRQNIYAGDPERKIQTKDIETAAQKADAHKFIKELEHNYDQVLDKRFSKGTNLSTGQKQKIALARMFYRDTPVLILDEPTAAIDAEAEYKIFKRIYDFIEGKTVIIISHRFSTVRNAKQIYVLEKGEIVESGSHTELLKKDGKYAKAFELQAKGYSTK